MTAARCRGAKLVRFRHNDATDLDKRLAPLGRRRGRPARGARGHLFDARRSRAAGRFRRGEARSMASSFSSTRPIPSACSGPMAAASAEEAGLEDECRFRRRHLLQERRRHRRLRRRQPSAVRDAALCHAALHVHGLVVAGLHCHIAAGLARPEGAAGP